MFNKDTQGVPSGRFDMLRRLPMFAGYSDEDLARVDALVYETTLPDGARLTVEGKVRRQVFIILSGAAKMEIGNQLVGRLTHGDLIGEMSLLTNRPQVATVTAEGPLRVLVMDPREFGTWLSDTRAACWLAGDQSNKLADHHKRPTTAPALVTPVQLPA